MTMFSQTGLLISLDLLLGDWPRCLEKSSPPLVQCNEPLREDKQLWFYCNCPSYDMVHRYTCLIEVHVQVQ